MSFTPGPRHMVTLPAITPFSAEASALSLAQPLAPSSGTWGTASKAYFYPLALLEPFTVAKAFWCNGATVGTDSIDLGAYLMTDMTTGRLDLIRSTGAVLSAGTVSQVQASATWKVAAANLTADVDSTDATTYTTASVTLKAGRLNLLSFVNTKAVLADVITSIAGGGTWTSRSTTDYNATIHRVSIWSCVPTVDYTGTIVVTFSAAQTSGRWSLNEFSGVDTATTDGVVQQAVGTGTSTTPLATLAAFGSANNATFGALANTADSTTTPGTGFRELSDLATSTTPASFLQTEWSEANDTTVDGTITLGAWGACAVEIKADTSPFVIPPSLSGNPNVYMGMSVSGTTATVLRSGPAAFSIPRSVGHLELATAFPLPSTCIPVALTLSRTPLAGFSSRSLIE